MSDWVLYTARGIIKDNKFDSSQIEEGLKLGLMPQIILGHGSGNPDIIKSLRAYFFNKEMSGILLPIAAHGRGTFDDSGISTARESIDAAIEINKGHETHIIKELIFHAGSVHTIDEEFRLKKEGRYGMLDATFTAKEYLKTMEKAKARILEASEYAGEHGIDILIENVMTNEFAMVPTGKIEDKPAEFRKDPRWGNTLFLPDSMQLGFIGCVHDLDYLTNKELPVCFDIEHFGQSVEYSQKYNLQNFSEMPESDEEEKVLGNYSILVSRGKPVLYKEPINPVEVIAGLKDRIPICHLGGQVDMVYEDKGIKKIGSHFPVTFGDDPNRFIEDDMLRKNQNYMVLI